MFSVFVGDAETGWIQHAEFHSSFVKKSFDLVECCVSSLHCHDNILKYTDSAFVVRNVLVRFCPVQHNLLLDVSVNLTIKGLGGSFDCGLDCKLLCARSSSGGPESTPPSRVENILAMKFPGSFPSIF